MVIYEQYEKKWVDSKGNTTTSLETREKLVAVLSRTQTQIQVVKTFIFPRKEPYSKIATDVIVETWWKQVWP